MYANEMPIKLIQRILGHTNSQMTMRYCHEQSSLEDIRQQMNIALAAGMWLTFMDYTLEYYSFLVIIGIVEAYLQFLHIITCFEFWFVT